MNATTEQSATTTAATTTPISEVKLAIYSAKRKTTLKAINKADKDLASLYDERRELSAFGPTDDGLEELIEMARTEANFQRLAHAALENAAFEHELCLREFAARLVAPEGASRTQPLEVLKSHVFRSVVSEAMVELLGILVIEEMITEAWLAQQS